MNADEFGKHIFVVLIGVNDVGNESMPRLESPEKDVTSIASALLAADGCSISKNNLTVLTGDKATKHACIEAIQILSGRAGRNDIVILYFAGHGFSNERSFFLCNYGAQQECLAETALSSVELNFLLEKIYVRGVLLILDCCKSAAFAELCPDFFRQLGGIDFKILLSASRSDELSWERPDGQGTLFSLHLREIVAGKRNISDTPGLIYFSELLHYLQNQLKEDFEAHFKNMPAQEPVFIGTYSQDPLLFVHRRLTLEQVKIKIRRYSKEYIRKLAFKGIAWFCGVVFFLSAFIYSLMDNLEFIRMENGSVISYSGIDHLQLFGFPKKQWEYDAGNEHLKPVSILLKGASIQGSLGEHADAILYKQLKQIYQAEIQIRNNRFDSARRIIYNELADAGALEGDKLFALTLLNEISNPGDTLILNNFLKDQNVQIRALAITAFFKYGSGKAPSLAKNDPSVRSMGVMVSNYLENCVVSNLCACNTPSKEYISFLLHFPYNYTRRLALEAAMRNSCLIADSDWLYVFKKIGGDDWGDDLSNHLLLLKPGNRNAVLTLLLNELQNANSATERKYIIKAIGLNDSVPEAVYLRYLNDPDPGIQYEALNACLHHYTGQQIIETHLKLFRSNFRFLPLLTTKKVISINELMDSLLNANSIQQERILDGLAGFSRSQLILLYERLNKILNNPQTYYSVKIKIINLFRYFRVPWNSNESLLKDNTVGVKMAAYSWYADDNETKAINRLLTYIDDTNPFFVYDVLADRQITIAQLDLIRAKVRGDANPSHSMIALLAVFGKLEDLQFLLKNPRLFIRNTASQFAVANPLLSYMHKIAEKQPTAYNPAIIKTAIQLKIADKMINELKSIPSNLRYWQLRQLQNSMQYTYDDNYIPTKGLVKYIQMKLGISIPLFQSE